MQRINLFNCQHKYKHVDVVVNFLSSCYQADFRGSLNFISSSLVNSPSQCEQIFNNSYNVGTFIKLKEITVLNNNGHVYCIVQHSNDDYQWIFYVDMNALKIAGWDQRNNGNYRNPSENNQQIKEILRNRDVAPQLGSVQQHNASATFIQSQRNRIVRFEWDTPVSKSDVSSNGLVELLMPCNRPYQKHIKFQVLSPSFQFVDHYESNGNTYVRVRPTSNFHFNTHVSYSLDIEFDSTPIQTEVYTGQWSLTHDDPKQYLGITYHTSARLDPTHPHIRQLLTSITSTLPPTARSDPAEIAKAIAYWVGNVPYQMIEPGMSWPTLEQYIQSGYKYMECGGHAIFFVCLARAAGIPARRLFHPWIVTSHDKFQRFDSHCIAEFYHPKFGWVPVDATTKFNHTNNQQWFRVPKPVPSSWPNSIVMTAEKSNITKM
ncbi:hypothetical protein PPL_05206 [Heterostelium album PN500]|uniref:Transglutaminase-like domain-containing protein n=1 Tax=Heterostelium pallidum (strain ATCC 26659 / Pp 5 / PN500) TaxID=670386 RepID=D3B9R0_HETP5|nr:hypothetical protein PPL_05206 [Heterostelium album PN500]EFA81972.1 hypothetical protein PPL_05206 [Heterostelium album PN500]|eukprot:XP_020434089.1 hypothetical protein PPL_05206 [Heterostelium album PN500]